MKPVQYAVAEKALSNKYTPIIVGVLVVGGILATYFIGRKILEGAGIVDTKFDNRIKYLKGFDPNYYKGNISRVTISTAEAQKIADNVHYSYGFSDSSTTALGSVVGNIINQTGGTQQLGRQTFYGNDDEEKLIGAIQSAGSEYNLSKASDIFQKKYGKNMVEYIFSFANNAETEAIYKIIKSW